MTIELACSPAAVRVDRFCLADLESARGFFATAFQPDWQLQGWSSSSCVTVRRQAAGGLVIDEFVVEGPMSCNVRIAGGVVVIQPRVGTVAVAAQPMAGPHAAMLTEDGSPASLDVNSAQFHVVSIDMNLLNKVAAEDNPHQIPPITLGSPIPLPLSAVGGWYSTFDYVLADLNDAACGPPPMRIHAATQLLAAAALECFPCNAPAGRDQPETPATSKAFREAVMFMHHHAGDDISIQDVAEAVNLTPRAVQYVFRQQADMTPMGYLRRVRLQSARADLLRGHRSDTSITDVAHKWGFGHAGRFSAYYRKAYGELPQATLTLSVFDETEADRCPGSGSQTTL